MDNNDILKDIYNKLRQISKEDSIKYIKQIGKIYKLCDEIRKESIKSVDKGKYREDNKLNDLTGKEWIKFTKSWFVSNPPPRTKNEILHPAKYPESMIEEFIRFFTKKGETVLDPFLGTGSTIVACNNTDRIGYGIEIIPKYYKIAEDRINAFSKNIEHHIFNDDCNNIIDIWHEKNLQKVDFIITSPPYWNMLKKSRGNVRSNHKIRQEKELDLYYSDDNKDLGNIDDYDTFVEKVINIFEKIKHILKEDKYLVIVLQNMRDMNGEMKTLAWDVKSKLQNDYTFVGEKLWLQDNKKLGIWGYPYTFVSNVHHQYCLIFKNNKVFSDKKKVTINTTIDNKIKKLDNIDWNFNNSVTNKYTHDFHPYHAKFVPQIPHNLISVLTKEGDNILDPFCGSGTTLVESIINHRNAIGVDSSPLAALMSKVKTTLIKSHKLKIEIENLKTLIDINKKNNNALIPDFLDKTSWFTPENIMNLGYIWNAILAYKDDKEVFDFFKLAFSSILKRVANYQKSWNWTCIGDNMLPNIENTIDVLSVFNEKIKNMYNSMLELEKVMEKEIEAKVYKNDSRKISQFIGSEIDLIVTSPPYPFAVDFNRYYRLSYYWFNWDIDSFKEEEIGARAKRSRKDAINRYIKDIEVVYKELYKVLGKNRYMCMTLGNTSRDKKKVDAVKITKDICENLGFKLVHKITRSLTNQSMAHKKIINEDLLIFKK